MYSLEKQYYGNTWVCLEKSDNIDKLNESLWDCIVHGASFYRIVHIPSGRIIGGVTN